MKFIIWTIIILISLLIYGYNAEKNQCGSKFQSSRFFFLRKKQKKFFVQTIFIVYSLFHKDFKECLMKL